MLAAEHVGSRAARGNGRRPREPSLQGHRPAGRRASKDSARSTTAHIDGDGLTEYPLARCLRDTPRERLCAGGRMQPSPRPYPVRQSTVQGASLTPTVAAPAPALARLAGTRLSDRLSFFACMRSMKFGA
jgi:hypothetical protein